MLRVIVSKESEVSKLRALGVKELEPSEWAADQLFKPFTQREYGNVYKTVTRGSKKRA